MRWLCRLRGGCVRWLCRLRGGCVRWLCRLRGGCVRWLCRLRGGCVRWLCRHPFVFQRLASRTELFHGLVQLRRQADWFVEAVVDALLASRDKEVLGCPHAPLLPGGRFLSGAIGAARMSGCAATSGGACRQRSVRCGVRRRPPCPTLGKYSRRPTPSCTPPVPPAPLSAPSPPPPTPGVRRCCWRCRIGPRTSCVPPCVARALPPTGAR